MKQNFSFSIRNVSPKFWQVFPLLMSFLVFSFILVSRSPIFIRPVSMALRTGFGLIIPLTALVIYGIIRLPKRMGEILLPTAVMSVFALGLAGLWASGITQTISLSGLIPISDATNYYIDATRILHGADISNFSGMRPLFAGMLAALLWLTERNLMAALGILTGIAGFASYLTVRELKKTHGAEAAVFFLMLIFLYYRHHSGTTMTESLSVAVSLMGTALLWQSISLKKEWLSLLGIAMIGLALNIRPGAMFVLPALLLWGGWVYRGERKFSLRFFLLGALLIGLSFYVNNLMIQALMGSKGIAFENFSWAFYGLASGGNSWTYVFQAHPELQALDNSESNAIIYKLAFDLILENPSLLIKGALFYWGMFFSNTWYNAYSFMAGENYWVNEAARWGMYLFSGLGILAWFKDRKDPFATLSLWTALGVLASVPFVPPTDAYRVRLYAATIPFFILLPTMGLSFLLKKLKVSWLDSHTVQSPESNYLTISLSIVTTLLLVFAPMFVKATGTLPTAPSSSCPSEMDSILIRYDRGTYVNILRENVAFLDWMPNFHASTFRRSAHALADTNLAATLESVSPPSTLFYALDFQSNQEALVIIETKQLPPPGQMLHLCGIWESAPEISAYRVFHANYPAGTR